MLFSQCSQSRWFAARSSNFFSLFAGIFQFGSFGFTLDETLEGNTVCWNYYSFVSGASISLLFILFKKMIKVSVLHIFNVLIHSRFFKGEVLVKSSVFGGFYVFWSIFSLRQWLRIRLSCASWNLKTYSYDTCDVTLTVTHDESAVCLVQMN